MPTDTFDSFSHRLDKFVNGLSGGELKQVMTKVGVAAKGDALKAASADLGGNPSFSGWTNKAGDPINLDTRFQHHSTPGRITLSPTGKSAGPWTVAEFGRNSTAGPRMTGPRLTQTGRVSTARVRRYNGRTDGKGTATTALAIIERESPKRVEVEVKKAIRKAFD